jgi:hypothetical protein
MFLRSFDWISVDYIALYSIEVFIITAVRTSDPTKLNSYTSGRLMTFLLIYNITENSASKHTDILARVTEHHNAVICICHSWSGSLGCVNVTSWVFSSVPSSKFWDSTSECAMTTSLHILSISSLRIRRYLIKDLQNAALYVHDSGFNLVPETINWVFNSGIICRWTVSKKIETALILPIYVAYISYVSWGSVVSKATAYGLDDRGVGVRVPVG